jgi:AraC family transcriptional regulator
MQQRLSTREDYSRRINIIVEYINNHLADDIDLEMLASISNFSPYHFHRITKAFLGEPIGAFVTRLRVETAARLLRYGDMPIQNIAYRVGYDVPSSLSKAFKTVLWHHANRI